MSKPISIGQSHNVISTLANNVDWSILDSEMLQKIVDNPKMAGQQFTAFLKNCGKMVVAKQGFVTIDRSKLFDSSFVGKDFSIDEQDERSLKLTEVDLSMVDFVTMLKSGEKYITGEERLKRLKEFGSTRLDAKIFQTLWENQHLIPESWKDKVNGETRLIYFDGTVLRSPGGRRYTLYLCWIDSRWHWDYFWLGNFRFANDPSAVLAS